MSINKVALLSVHDQPNYGSMLQAYALAEAIRREGYDVEYLNYSTAHKPYSFFSIVRKLISVAQHLLGKNNEYSFLTSDSFINTMKAFSVFHNQYIPVSERKYYWNNVKKCLNVNDYCNYIVGSDQVWSPLLYSQRRPYFLDFAKLPKRNSYASSIGVTNITDQYKDILRSKLSLFDNLSCRERRGVTLLSEMTGKDVKYVLDPTLLLCPQDWDGIVCEPNISTPYILVYLLGEKEEPLAFANVVGTMNKMPVYIIQTRPKYCNICNSIPDVGPSEFVGLIKNASCVITDSFHGTLFSINYHVNFYSFAKRPGGLSVNDNTRIPDFLTELGLQSRFQPDDDPQILPDIDYHQVDKSLELLRKTSIEYLRKILND